MDVQLIANARKTGRSPSRPYVPIIIRRYPARDRVEQLRGVAFAVRADAVRFAQKTIAHREEHAAKAAAAFAERRKHAAS